MSNKTELWLGICDRDLKGAHGMLRTENYLLAGFQCHQVVEKALKAIISSISTNDPPRIHDLAKLIVVAELQDVLSADQKKLVDCLDPLYIEARYINYKKMILMQLTPEYTQQLVSQTEEFLSWTKNRLTK